MEHWPVADRPISDRVEENWPTPKTSPRIFHLLHFNLLAILVFLKSVVSTEVCSHFSVTHWLASSRQFRKRVVSLLLSQVGLLLTAPQMPRAGTAKDASPAHTARHPARLVVRSEHPSPLGWCRGRSHFRLLPGPVSGVRPPSIPLPPRCCPGHAACPGRSAARFLPSRRGTAL